MKKKHLKTPFTIILFLALFHPGIGQNELPASGSGIQGFTSGMDKMEGFIDLYWDEKRGKIWMELDKFDSELLYYTSLAAGVGSNDIGLDRGKIHGTHVIEFQRTGNKVLLVESNYGYRALSDNLMERLAVEESFAKSVLWGFDVAAEEGGKVLVDGT